VSVRQRAVDLLYAMCDRSNAERIVQEMLGYLEAADYSIREEMVLKTAILAEKYATDYNWYVDVILQLIRVAGDYVSEEVWHRVIQVQLTIFCGVYKDGPEIGRATPVWPLRTGQKFWRFLWKYIGGKRDGRQIFF